MKKIYLFSLKTLLALFMVLTPVLFYGQNAKMWRQYNKVDIIASTPTLTEKGGLVEVTFDVVVPGGYFSKSAAMFVQQELRFKDGKITLKPLTLKGEDVTGEGVTINHKEGGKYTYTDSFKYDSKVNRSELYVVSTVYMGKDGTIAGIQEIMDNPRSYECCHRLVIDGVIYTSERLLKKMAYTVAPDLGYDAPEVISPKNAVVYFAVNKFDINWNLPLNKNANTEAKFHQLTDFSKEGWKIKTISIDGWASPEGIAVNDKLSENRANVIYAEVIKKLDQLLKQGGNFSFSNPSQDLEYLFSFRGSDWDGFLNALEASNLKDKKVIAESIKNATTENAKDQALKSAMYKYAGVREILAPLRRTELAINYIEPYKSQSEVSEMALSNPGSLELKELLYAAANAQEDQKLGIYEVVFEKFPKCWISKNNAAVIYMQKGNYVKAGELLNSAHEMYPDQGTVNANLGALAVYQGDFTKAAEYFAKAKEQGVEVDKYNLGVMEIVKGDYKKAAELLDGNACDYNAGLAQLLAEDYQKAEATLKCTKDLPCQAAYLVAVIGARTNDANKVFENLKKAFDLNPALKAQAMYDREFQNYRNSDKFKALVK